MLDSERYADRLERVEMMLRALARPGRRANRILITGGTGTLGTALTKHFRTAGYELTVLSRDGHRQALYSAQFPDVRMVLADICDYDKVVAACHGQDIVIHAAAQKRVDIGETQVAEFARVNIDGTRTVARACRAAGVARALFISSDKAVSPLNFYGVTKALGERLWTDCDALDGPLAPRFACVRYGNVMGSNGSVLQVWQARLAQKQKIVVRAPETTRFFMSVQDAVDLVSDALTCMQGGEIFVPTQTPAFYLYALARQVAPETQWEYAPLGPREKQHEVLLAPGECWEPTTKNMVRVWPGKAGCFDVPPQFCSATAPQLSGAEALRLLGG